jgi:hypothetical protein
MGQGEKFEKQFVVSSPELGVCWSIYLRVALSGVSDK